MNIDIPASKKQILGLSGAAMLWQAGAPTWQIMVVISITVIVQGILDYVKKEIPKTD